MSSAFTFTEEQIQSFRDKLPIFDGNDFNLEEKPGCFNLGCAFDDEDEDFDSEGEQVVPPPKPKDEDKKLMKCARCKVALYCSKKCQQKDFPEHKEYCKNIAKCTKKMLKHEEELKHCNHGFGNRTENLFETSVGHFWGILETRDYCRARHSLAMELKYLAHVTEYKFLWEEVLKHQLELLRLIHSDNMGIRSIVPFVMTQLGKDDEAYGFVKWWATIDPDGRYDWGNVPESKPGDWLYLKKEEADKFEDPFELQVKNFETSHWVVILLIKLKILATHEGNLKKFEEFFLSAGPNAKGLDVTKEMIVGSLDQIKRIEVQRDIVEKLMKHIHKKNPSILPALINPGPLRSQAPPSYFSMGTPEEAYGIVEECCRQFARTPNAHDVIEKFLGKGSKPEYKWKFESPTFL